MGKLITAGDVEPRAKALLEQLTRAGCGTGLAHETRTYRNERHGLALAVINEVRNLVEETPGLADKWPRLDPLLAEAMDKVMHARNNGGGRERIEILATPAVHHILWNSGLTRVLVP